MARPDLYYEITVRGQIDRRREEWFEDMNLQVLSDGNTKISGYVKDQAALYGVLNKLRDLGLQLISVGQKRNQE